MNLRKNLILALSLLLAITLIPDIGLAKKKKKKKDKKNQAEYSEVEQRINQLSRDDKRKFKALSKKQQSLIKQGKIDQGFNEWMVKLALGKPYYGTEHHPIFVDYEQVWLYTKTEVKQDVDERRITDPKTNWPTLHRKIKKETCQIQDFFILWDRGVVQKVVDAAYDRNSGPCTISEEEEYLPIVDGKPVR